MLGSAAAQVAWEKANRTAHRELLKVLNGDVARGGTVTLNLHDLIAQVAAGTGLPAGVADRLPANLQQLQVLKTDKIEAAQKALKTAKTLVIVLIVLAVLLMAGAIALSTDRRRTVVACGGCVLFAGVAVLALRRVGGDAAVNALAEAPNARPAVKRRLRDRDVAAHRRGVGLDRLRPLPDHGRLAGGLRAARDGRAARECPGAARSPDLLPSRAGPPAAAARRLGAGAVDALFLAGAGSSAIAAFIWLPRARDRTLAEFGDVPAGGSGAAARAPVPAPRAGDSARRR